MIIKKISDSFMNCFEDITLIILGKDNKCSDDILVENMVTMAMAILFFA